MPRKIAIRIANLLWHSTALLIVLAAVAVTSGREMMPNINMGNEALSRYTSQRTGADIKIQGLHGEWTRLIPQFSVSGLTVKTPALQIQARDIHIDVDILRSVWRRTPVFDRLEMAGAKITLAQHENSEIDPEKIWQSLSLLLGNNIQVSDVDIEFYANGSQQHLHIADFRVEKRLLEKRFFLRIPGNNAQQTLSVTGSLKGNTLTNSAGKLYINMQNWPLDAWLPTINEKTPPLLRTILATAWQGNSESWINWQGMDTLSSVTRLQLQSNSKVSAENPVDAQAITPPSSISSEFSFDWQRGGNSTLQIHQLQVQSNEKPVDAIRNASININDANHWRIQIPAISLDNLSSLIHLLPENTLKHVLTSLHPAGEINNMDLQWDNTRALVDRMQLRANVSRLSTGAWSGVPAFTKVNGYLQTGIGYGFIDLDSRDGFSMFYPGIYHEPLSFQSAAGRVQWNWQPDEKIVLVGSDHARLLGDIGNADGNFWLYLPLDSEKGHSQMNLSIGLRNSRASYRNRLLPYTLPSNLLGWLKESIGEADIRDAGFIYRGALAGHEAFSRAVQFYANFDNGDLQFEKNWPRLTHLQGKVLVDDGYVEVRTQGGQIYNTTIESAMVTVNGHENDMQVNVNGRARGYAEDGLRILRETPLRQSLGSSFDNWRITHGLITAGVDLQIPIHGDAALRREDVRVSLFDTQLIMDDLRLQFDAMQGDLSYQTETGLRSPLLAGTLFGQPVELHVDSKKNRDNLSIAVTGNGKANCKDIAQWSRLRPLQMLDGELAYKAELSLGPFGKSAHDHTGQLRISSDMQDTSLPLPAPLQKKTGDKAPLDLVVDLYQNNRQDYAVTYNNQITGALSMRGGKLYSGDFIIADGKPTAKPTAADATKAPATAGPLRIHGKLPDGDLQPWFDMVSAYNRLPLMQDNNESYPEFVLTMNNAKWRDLDFPSLQLNIAHPDNAWKVDFNSTHANGYVNFFDNAATDKTSKPAVVINELKIYHQKKADSAQTYGADPNATTGNTPSINFADVPSATIRIDHLIYNDMDIGNINTELLSSPDSLQFSKLQMTGPGFAVRGKDSNPDAEMIWRRNADNIYQSEFHGMLHMQGEQPALKHIGADPFVRGENIYLASDLAWTGSPVDFSIPLLYGRVQTHGQNGKYLQANPNAAMQTISVFNIANWARRLRLDFSDLSPDGISFDEYHGEISFNNGDMAFTEPLTVQSPSSSMTLSGTSHLNTGQLDLQLTATLPVSSNATWITALAGGLPAAAGVYLVSKIFGDEIKNITSLTYTITGPSTEPDIRFARIAAPKEKTPAEKNK